MIDKLVSELKNLTNTTFKNQFSEKINFLIKLQDLSKPQIIEKCTELIENYPNRK